MPLVKSGSREAISTNIREMVAAGHPQKQAVAAALSTARRYGHAAGGGVTPPFGERMAARSLYHEGFLHSPVPGRTDKLPISVSGGAYVLPADHVAALGQGNSLAGASIVNKMFGMPYGSSPGGTHRMAPHVPHVSLKLRARGGKVEAEKVLPADHQLGMKVPKGGSMCANCRYLATPTTCGNKGFADWNGSAKLPEPANEYCCDLYQQKLQRAEGGRADHEHGKPVPIIAAGGEIVLPPEKIIQRFGSLEKGHKALDQWVIETRKKHVKTLQKLAPPRKD